MGLTSAIYAGGDLSTMIQERKPSNYLGEETIMNYLT